MKIFFSDYWAPVVAGGVLFVFSALLSPVSANMLVSPMTSSIDTKSKSASQLRVYSKSDSTQYVKVVVKRVVNPATEQEVEEDAPRSGAGGVTVSPSKFALPAGGSRLVRVIALGSPAKEELYRVHFEPVAAPADAVSESTESIDSNVDFGLVWAPLVRVLPSARLPDMMVSGGVLKNTGNIRLAVLEAGACDSEKPEAKCDWQPIKRSVYPDQSLKLPHAAKGDVWQFKYRLDGVADVKQNAVRSDVVEVPGA
ncbi:Alpha-fimbriae chaperone protein [Burkholderia gladioli]|uniref:fimbrial protein n=1 Tax=Burkholderia gladioli TaxID=28095 RepID=UPI001CB0B242|nr:fimbrial protein [Burkholderia gladioli]CAG9238932.1 Alpha-fimbriae chaperone protein [Burkholderia gladioli]